MRISFIIPHKGRENLLERTIQSIFGLDCGQHNIEIIVVTQNTTLECPYIDRNTVDFSIVFCSADDTISTLRNVGARKASGEYLAFLDADIQLSSNWLNVMFEELQATPERVLVGAVQHAAPDAGNIEKIRAVLWSASADTPVEFLAGANLYISRKLFGEVGGFPEEIATCEDYYFSNMVHQRGEIYCTSKTSFVHLGEDKNYSELFRKEIWRGQANLQSIKGRPMTLRELPSLLTPLWQAFFFILAVILVIPGRILPGVLSLFLFGLPVMLYAIRVYNMGRRTLSFIAVLRFYCVYLTARVIGTLMGTFKVISQ